MQKAFSSEGFEKQCNRPEFKWGAGPQRTDGCVHGLIRRSIVQNPLLLPVFNRTLSFSHCCLLLPLYHSASLHTSYAQTHIRGSARTVLLFFIPPLSLSPLDQHHLSFSANTSPPLLLRFLFPSAEERDKEIVFLSPPIRSAQLHKPANTLLFFVTL